MHYVLLIHAAEARFRTMSPEGRGALSAAYGRYTEELLATGRAGDRAALEPTAAATTVQVREGKRIVKDGPFAETREQLGGYYTLDAASLEEAVAWAARIPSAIDSTMEVRPLPPWATPSTERPKTVDPASYTDYLLLIYESEALWAKMPEADRKVAMARYMELGQSLRTAGHFVAGAPLDTVAKARCVNLAAGERVVRDGPFAETREQLGGYYRILAKNLDEAIAVATRIPAAETGTIEIRPIRHTGG